MLNRFFGDSKEKKRKEEHERELKERLAQKTARYEQERLLKAEIAAAASDDTDFTDHTEVTLNGKKVRVAKQQITIQDVDVGKQPADFNPGPADSRRKD